MSTLCTMICLGRTPSSMVLGCFLLVGSSTPPSGHLSLLCSVVLVLGSQNHIWHIMNSEVSVKMQLLHTRSPSSVMVSFSNVLFSMELIISFWTSPAKNANCIFNKMLICIKNKITKYSKNNCKPYKFCQIFHEVINLLLWKSLIEFRNPLADRKTSNLSSLGALASVMVTGARDWLMQVHLQLCRSPNGSYFFRDYFQFPES